MQNECGKNGIFFMLHIFMLLLQDANEQMLFDYRLIRVSIGHAEHRASKVNSNRCFAVLYTQFGLTITRRRDRMHHLVCIGL